MEAAEDVAELGAVLSAAGEWLNAHSTEAALRALPWGRIEKAQRAMVLLQAAGLLSDCARRRRRRTRQ